MAQADPRPCAQPFPPKRRPSAKLQKQKKGPRAASVQDELQALGLSGKKGPPQFRSQPRAQARVSGGPPAFTPAASRMEGSASA